MSKRLAAQATASIAARESLGPLSGDSKTPPNDSQLPQDAPSHQRCHSALSVPTTKMSSRFGAQATTRGEDSSTPESDSEPPQLAGSSRGKTLSVPGRLTGVPAGKCRCSSA